MDKLGWLCEKGLWSYWNHFGFIFLQTCSFVSQVGWDCPTHETYRNLITKLPLGNVVLENAYEAIDRKIKQVNYCIIQFILCKCLIFNLSMLIYFVVYRLKNTNKNGYSIKLYGIYKLICCIADWEKKSIRGWSVWKMSSTLYFSLSSVVFIVFS